MLLRDSGLGALRQLWDTGQPTVGGWCAIPSAHIAELLGGAGFDWVVIDMQHGLIELGDLAVMLPALASCGVPAIVRVPWNEPSYIMRVLDLGAQGVIVPMVNSADDARIAVQACRYPPYGIRSWGPVRAALHTPNFTPELANQAVVCVVMVETVDAVGRVEEILSVPGIDGVFVGPNDLALSAGFAPTPEPTEPEHQRLIEAVLKACRARGVVAGIACGSASLARRWRSQGFRMLAAPADATLIRSAAEALVREIG